ncbi:MAG: response regulator [Acidobacteria bacterium]|nr:MAG: response regulator [Acidobacteriota bacterium]
MPQREDANSRIFAFVDDLFFLAKIQETARKLNVKVEFVKTEKDLLDRMNQNGEEKPSLIIFDLNNANAKPLALIPKLKSKLKKGTSIIGFLSHVQGDLKQKAHEVGCDMVLPRSAFSQNLPQLLRRHGAPEEENVS